jgi:capsular polysaccharide biosynthesis protein
MRNFIMGTVFGIVVATVGFSGIAKILDNGVQKTKDIAVEGAK